jgi:hypothetical protein
MPLIASSGQPADLAALLVHRRLVRKRQDARTTVRASTVYD